MADLLEQLRTVARALDAAAPTVRPDEVAGGLAPSPGGGRWSDRRGLVLLGVAAAVVAAVVVAALAWPEDRQVRTVTSVPDTSATPSAPRVVPLPATTTPTTTTTTSPATTTTVVVPAATVAEQVGVALSGFESFSATTTQTRYDEDAAGVRSNVDVRAQRVTMLADGRLWATNGDGEWSSYDPASGLARILFHMADGSLHAQELMGQEDGSLPTVMAIGHDPVLRFDSINELESTTTPDRERGWATIVDDAESTSTTVIDERTGLVVATHRVTTRPDGTSEVVEAALTDVETNVAMPSDFPGTFPADVVVDRSGDPDAFRTTTLADAAATYGQGLLRPADGRELRTTISDRPMVFGGSVRAVAVSTSAGTGFARTTIVQTKLIPSPGGASTFGVIPIDDGGCFSDDGVTCRPSGDPVIASIDSGPRAGTTITAQGNATAVTASRRATVVTAIAPTPALALDTTLGLVEV